MRRIKRFIARVYDLPNAYRVLDIMDEAGGCDIEEVLPGRWNIYIKRYISKEDAEDLRHICLHNRQFKKRSPLWNKLFFRNFRYGCRVLKNWV